MSLATLLQAIEQFADECSNAYDEDPAGVPESAAVVLAAFRDCRADLAMLAKKVEQDLIAMAGSKRFTVPVMGEVEIKRNTSYTHWDSEALTRVVVARALDERMLNEETGEYEPAHEAVARALSECARPSWRVTPLRARGIQVDEFCHVEQESWSVKLPRRAADVQIGDDDD